MKVDREGAEEFNFYDGPPFATGTPHYGHLLAWTIKDVVPRYQTMKGKKVYILKLVDKNLKKKYLLVNWKKYWPYHKIQNLVNFPKEKYFIFTDNKDNSTYIHKIYY